MFFFFFPLVYLLVFFFIFSVFVSVSPLCNVKKVVFSPSQYAGNLSSSNYLSKLVTIVDLGYQDYHHLRIVSMPTCRLREHAPFFGSKTRTRGIKVVI